MPSRRSLPLAGNDPPPPRRQPSRFPRAIQIQTIAACDRRCPSCPYSAGFRSTGTKLPTALFDRIVGEGAEHPELGLIALELHNEPLLDKRLPDLIKRVKRARSDLAAVVVTNASRVTQELAEALQEGGLDQIMVSLNAVDQQSYRDVFGTGNYAEAVKRIDILAESQLVVDVSYLITKDSAGAVFQFLKRWERRGFHVRLWLAHDRCSYLGPEAFLPMKPPSCSRVYESCAITAEGDVLPCCNDWGRSRILGNVRDHSLAAIWTGAAYRQFRQRYESDPGGLDPCSTCTESTDFADTLRVLHGLIESGVGAFEWQPSAASGAGNLGLAYRASRDYVPMIRRGRYFFQPVSGHGKGFVLDEDIAALAVGAFEMVLHTGYFSPRLFDQHIARGAGDYSARDVLAMLREAELVQEAGSREPARPALVATDGS